MQASEKEPSNEQREINYIIERLQGRNLFEEEQNFKFANSEEKLREIYETSRNKKVYKRDYILASIFKYSLWVLIAISIAGFVPAPIILACLKKYSVIIIKSFIKGISFAGSICLVSFFALALTAVLYRVKKETLTII